MTRNEVKGHLASFGCYAIFGLNIVFCKDIANSEVLTPYALFFLRAVGATALFWLVSLFLPKEKIDRNDMLKIVFAAFIGMFIPQMTFLIAITMTTSIDSSILGSLSPIFTMFFAAYFVKEPITWKKTLGVVLSFAGVVMLIMNSMLHKEGGVEHTAPMGIVLLVINTLCFALYIGAFKPLISRYHVITFMKWMFLYTLIICLPFCMDDTSKLISTIAEKGNIIPTDVMLETLYVIIFATFVSYFLIPVGQKHIRPTMVSMYSYVQPVLAVIISIGMGIDTMTWTKFLALILVTSGVFIVNNSRWHKWHH